ncbi:MAG: hypothetical protein K9L74_07630, partial [Candidatus Izimaplasma sp.]|nr:hypothetical protein [Candidatus Izimaplasma bacterium]
IGENGNWFVGETDTGVRAQGWSAFEIYQMNYPGYEGTEEEWIEALSMDELVLTLTVVYNNDVEEEIKYLNGDVLGVSPYEVNWYLDAGFTNLADEEYITEDMMVYINIASDDLPEPTLEDVFKVTDLEANATDGIYRIVSGETIFTLADNVFLYQADGSFKSFGDVDVHGDLSIDDLLADITVVDGEVVELRFASNNVAIESSDDAVVVNVDPTTSAISLELDFYGITVLDIHNALAPLSSVDSRVQEYTVLDGDGVAVTTGTTVVEDDFTLKIVAEDGKTSAVATIGFDGDESGIYYDETDDSILEDSDTNSVTVLPGTLQDALLASLETTDDDYPTMIKVFNSEMVAKTNDELAIGDKVLLTSADGTVTQVLKVEVLAADDVAIEFDGDAAGSVIDLPWNFVADDVLDLVTSENGYVQTYDLQIDLADDDPDEGFITYTNDGTLIQDGDFQLVVTAEDGTTTATHTFNVLDSDSTDVVVADDMDHVVTDLETDTIDVAWGTEDTDFAAALTGADGSTPTYAVKTPAESTRNGDVYTGDVLVVTSESGDETAEFTITRNAQLTDAYLYTMIDDLTFQVVTDISSSTITIVPNLFVDEDQALDEVALNEVVNYLEADLDAVTDYKFQNDALIEFLMDNPNYQPDDSEPDYDPDEFIPWDKAALADLIVRVYAQDDETTRDYSVEYDNKNGDDTLAFADTVEDTLIRDLDGTNIIVYAANSDSDSASAIIANFDLESELQTYDTGVNSETGNLEITVIAEDGGTRVYTVIEFTYEETDFSDALVDEPDVITDIDDYAKEVEVLPESTLGNPTDAFDMVGDLDTDVYNQSFASDFYEYDDVAEAYELASGVSDVADFVDGTMYYFQVTAEDGTEDYYEVVVLDKLSNTNVYEVADQEVFTISGNEITVAHDATVGDLLGAIDLVTYFQDSDVADNAENGKNSSDDLFDYDTLTITAQDGTTEEYMIFVADAPAAPPSDSTDLSTVPALVTVVDNSGLVITVSELNSDDDPITVADLLAELEAEFTDMTFEFTTSEGLVKSADALYDYDLLVVTAADGTTTATYTITIEVK